MKKSMLKGMAAMVVGMSSIAPAGASDGWYPGPFVEAPGPQKSRAQVIAELQETRRLGLLHPGGEGDIPQATEEQERMIARAGGAADSGPFVVSSGLKSRARVVAELREAQRLGLVTAGGEADPPQATPEQEALIVMAGERADFADSVAQK